MEILNQEWVEAALPIVEIEGLKDVVIRAGGTLKMSKVLNSGEVAAFRDTMLKKVFAASEFDLIKSNVDEITAHLQGQYDECVEALHSIKKDWDGVHNVYFFARQQTLRDMPFDGSNLFDAITVKV